MNRFCYHFSLAITTIIITVAPGCGGRTTPKQQTTQPAQAESPSNQQLLDAIAQAERESQNVEPPEPVIELAIPPGWTKSERRPLPLADHGFTIAYDHESGLSVTFYQFTRGLSSIPNDINSPLVRDELQRAKTGILQVVEAGYYQAAKETNSRTVKLGDSQQDALWTQYELTVDGNTRASKIYVWASANHFFKLRCTSDPEDAASCKAALKPLLTMLGSAPKQTGK